jgi:serine phosphatase RsbU (regulator of sigma subunit)
VSGDFYWYDKQGPITMMAAADCTGHGVPGALMSMLGNDKLHYAVNSRITDPGEILAFVNAGVKTTLKQNEEQKKSQDGMDIALCCFDLSKNILRYAGANRPLWLIRNGKLTEYKPTKSAIGGYTETTQKFETHEIALEKGDALYIATDGFADQFGGDKGKKLMTKNLKDLLLSLQHIPIQDQEKILDEKLKQWQGTFEQVDDILVIGIRI